MRFTQFINLFDGLSFEWVIYFKLFFYLKSLLTNKNCAFIEYFRELVPYILLKQVCIVLCTSNGLVI